METNAKVKFVFWPRTLSFTFHILVSLKVSCYHTCIFLMFAWTHILLKWKRWNAIFYGLIETILNVHFVCCPRTMTFQFSRAYNNAFSIVYSTPLNRIEALHLEMGVEFSYNMWWCHVNCYLPWITQHPFWFSLSYNALKNILRPALLYDIWYLFILFS